MLYHPSVQKTWQSNLFVWTHMNAAPVQQAAVDIEVMQQYGVMLCSSSDVFLRLSTSWSWVFTVLALGRILSLYETAEG